MPRAIRNSAYEMLPYGENAKFSNLVANSKGSVRPKRITMTLGSLLVAAFEAEECACCAQREQQTDNENDPAALLGFGISHVNS